MICSGNICIKSSFLSSVCVVRGGVEGLTEHNLVHNAFAGIVGTHCI
jgi:hypothetical protein